MKVTDNILNLAKESGFKQKGKPSYSDVIIYLIENKMFLNVSVLDNWDKWVYSLKIENKNKKLIHLPIKQTNHDSYETAMNNGLEYALKLLIRNQKI